ncbi:MAG: hypothetical protein WCT08_05610 [Patescibacteria group bacterium]|jgi:hypothetical protein
MDTMSPSNKTITLGQRAKIQELIDAVLRKSGLPSKFVQQVIMFHGADIAKEFVELLRERVELFSNMIIRRAVVDRSRSPWQVLDATGREQNTEHTVVIDMPKGKGEKVVVYFFKVGRQLSNEALAEEYARRDLVPADVYSLAQVNIDDPDFAAKYPNGVQWNDKDGKWCWIRFALWPSGRHVSVSRLSTSWNSDEWFAGVPAPKA